MTSFFTNALGCRIPRVGVPDHWACWQELTRLALGSALSPFGSRDWAAARAEEVIATMASAEPLATKEQRLRARPWVAMARKQLPPALRKRARLIGRQIRPWLRGSRIFDLGCGNGLVMHLQPHHWVVQLSDVENHVWPEVKFPFIPWRPIAGAMPRNRPETVLLLTVLHHARRPQAVLRAACRLRPNRIIVIESVLDRPVGNAAAARALLRATDEGRAWFATVADWFYNRILQTESRVPFNFAHARDWTALFEQHGYRLRHARRLGIDQPLVPEVHWLGVFETAAKSSRP